MHGGVWVGGCNRTFGIFGLLSKGDGCGDMITVFLLFVLGFEGKLKCGTSAMDLLWTTGFVIGT